jgi:L-threonylcarbamoyladenylate synthase
MPQVIEINPFHPQDALIRQAVEALKAGSVVAFPTETFYGLAVDAVNDAAIGQIFRVKGRSFSNPIALIAGSQNDFGDFTSERSDVARRLMQAFWPGPLTLLFAATPRVSPRLTAGTGKIGVRISSHPIANALAKGLGGPITATSANLAGGPECRTAAEVLASLGDHIDLMLDGGITPGGRGSTIIDVTTDPPACLRDGAVSAALIFQAINNMKKKTTP